MRSCTGRSRATPTPTSGSRRRSSSRRFPDGDKWIAELKKELESDSKVTWDEVSSTLGGRTAIVVYAESLLDVQVVGLLKPDDIDKAMSLIERINQEEPDDPLVARKVDDWVVVSDKEASIDAALKGEGQALSDVETFHGRHGRAARGLAHSGLRGRRRLR